MTLEEIQLAWHNIGTHGPPNSAAPLSVDIAGMAILLVRLDDGWHAIEDRCSHAGCSFTDDGEIDGLLVVCDCHGSEFEISTGRPVVGPASESLRTFRVRLTDAGLEVDV